jgi:hypothetical protein
MDNIPPHWRIFLRNLGWYLATLLVLVQLMGTFRSSFVLFALWLVGLGWGAVLAFQFSRLLFTRSQTIIGEGKLHTYPEQAQTYQTKINRAIKSAESSAYAGHLAQLSRQINDWVEAVIILTQRLSNLQQDDIIRRDLQQVPAAIADLQRRMEQETDPGLKTQLTYTLENRQKQMDTLEQLQYTMKRAEIQIENTLSMLGTIYSQLLTGQSANHVADYSHLSADVDEEVRRLQDYLDALHEVKLGDE